MSRMLGCDPVDQLRVGTGPETGNGCKIRFFWEGPKWLKKWPGKRLDRQKMAKFQLSSRLPGHLSAIVGPPRKMGAGHFAGHFRPFAVSGPCPTCPVAG